LRRIHPRVWGIEGHLEYLHLLAHTRRHGAHESHGRFLFLSCLGGHILDGWARKRWSGEDGGNVVFLCVSQYIIHVFVTPVRPLQKCDHLLTSPPAITRFSKSEGIEAGRVAITDAFQFLEASLPNTK
jgi:hypothetical protein